MAIADPHEIWVDRWVKSDRPARFSYFLSISPSAEGGTPSLIGVYGLMRGQELHVEGFSIGSDERYVRDVVNGNLEEPRLAWSRS